MKKIIISLLTLANTSAFSATKAKILAVGADKNIVAIALNSERKPKINGKAKSFPTIKDFTEESSPYLAFCYMGDADEAAKLLMELTFAPDANGAPWAELDSIDVSSTTGEIIVNAVIANEVAGINEGKSLVFAPCK